MQFPNLWWQTGQPLPLRVPRCLSLAWHLEPMPFRPGLERKPGAPRHTGDCPGPPSPRCGWREQSPLPLNLSCSLLTEAALRLLPTASQREPAISPHLEVKHLNLTSWAFGAGWLLCLSPSLRALFYPLKCQPGLSLLIGVSKIAPLVSHERKWQNSPGRGM